MRPTRVHRPGTLLKGVIYAGDSVDLTDGSWADHANFKEYHFGEGGGDTLDLNDGNDYSQGGSGDDTTHADEGSDVCWSDGGMDVAYGNEDADCVIDDPGLPGAGRRRAGVLRPQRRRLVVGGLWRSHLRLRI